MFNLSFGEIFLIIILAFLLLKPKDIPSLVNSLKKGFSKLMSIKSQVMDEFKDFNDDVKTIENDLLENNKIIQNDGPKESIKDAK